MTTDTIVRVDPKTLLVGPNVRKEITLPAEFAASVKLHGVLIPIVAQESDSGLEVIDGQMRTLAALDAGLKTVPVFVQKPAATDANRLVDQLVVNRDRTALSRADTIAAVKQLALDFKMPAATIAKKVGVSRAEVDQVVTIATSKNADAVLEHESISLELAAKIAEAELTTAEVKEVVGSRWNPDHTLQEVINRREAAAKTKELAAEMKTAGVPVVAKPSKDDYNADPKNKHLWIDALVDKETDKKLALEEHKSCPGHAAFIGVRGYRGEVEVHYVCTDPSKFGHRDVNRQPPKQLTDADKKERAVNSAAAKVWSSIVEVRQTWIREQLLTRKTMPAGWEKLVALVALEEAGSGNSWNWGPFAAELMQIEETGYNASVLVKWFTTHPAKPQTVLLVWALAQFELSAGVSKSWKGWQAREIAAYLATLQSWGYGLSELEQSIVDGVKAATAA